MRGPSFQTGVIVAAGFAFVASAVIGALTPFVETGGVVRLVIPGISLAYIVYLMRSSGERTGNLVTMSLWSVLAVASWWISPSLPIYLLIHAAAIWLVRCLYFHAGVFPALADLGLTALSLAALAWAGSRTGSVFMATWCFFLVQSLYAAIPETAGRKRQRRQYTDNENFERARRQADAALRQLMSN